MSKNTFNELNTLISEQELLESKLKTIRQQLTEMSATITPDVFENYTYDEIKPIWDKIKYYISSTADFEEVINRKKAEKYPALKRATYYPEINDLPISAEDKVRLDRAARENYHFYINRYNIDNLKHPLSEEDLETLKEIGIVEKKYSFRCPGCGCSATMISEKDLQNHLRVWELEDMEHNTEDEYDEIQTLYDEGYGDIVISCLDCDEDCQLPETISSKEKLEEYEDCYGYTPTYYIKKAPDLTYEKM